MRALEYLPNLRADAISAEEIQMNELVEIAREVVHRKEGLAIKLTGDKKKIERIESNQKNSPRLCLGCLKTIRQQSHGSSCGMREQPCVLHLSCLEFLVSFFFNEKRKIQLISE